MLAYARAGPGAFRSAAMRAIELGRAYGENAQAINQGQQIRPKN
jgi:hypothetical protein